MAGGLFRSWRASSCAPTRIHEVYVYIGGLVMLYAVLAIIAILLTPQTKGANLQN
jgi:hypothetical protein